MRVVTIAVAVSMIAGASAFGVAPVSFTRSSNTAVFARLAEEERSADQKEIVKMCDRWAEIRHYSAEEAKEKLSSEELETYEAYHAKKIASVTKMTEIVNMMMKNVDPPKIKPKGKAQRKRDKHATNLEREALRAAARN